MGPTEKAFGAFYRRRSAVARFDQALRDLEIAIGNAILGSRIGPLVRRVIRPCK